MVGHRHRSIWRKFGNLIPRATAPEFCGSANGENRECVLVLLEKEAELGKI